MAAIPCRAAAVGALTMDRTIARRGVEARRSHGVCSSNAERLYVASGIEISIIRTRSSA